MRCHLCPKKQTKNNQFNPNLVYVLTQSFLIYIFTLPLGFSLRCTLPQIYLISRIFVLRLKKSNFITDIWITTFLEQKLKNQKQTQSKDIFLRSLLFRNKKSKNQSLIHSKDLFYEYKFFYS